MSQNFYNNNTIQNSNLFNFQSTDFEETLSKSSFAQNTGNSSDNVKKLLGMNQQSRSIRKPNRQAKKRKASNLFKEDVNPSQMLNELMPGLQFTFELDNTKSLEIRYNCKAAINGFFYTGNGSSKKEAKRICSDKIMCALYPDSYKKHVTSDDECVKKKHDRVQKILNLNSIRIKTAAQLLNELDPTLARSGRYGCDHTAHEKKFSYEIQLQCESQKSVKGFGKSKKNAKNEASKIAIKELYDVDTDQVLRDGKMNNDESAEANQTTTTTTHDHVNYNRFNIFKQEQLSNTGTFF